MEEQYRQTVDQAQQLPRPRPRTTAASVVSTGALLAFVALVLGATAGWLGGRSGRRPSGLRRSDGPHASAAGITMSRDDPTTIALAEETAKVTLREAETGRVRVTTRTEVSTEVIRQELQGMTAEVVRVPVDRTLEPGETPPAPRTEGDVMIIPIFEEVVVVEKRIVLKEELHITQRVTTETVEVPVELRKQRASVERFSPDDESN